MMLGATLGGVALVGGSALADLGGAQQLAQRLEAQRERKVAVESELSGLGDERAELKGRLRDHAQALYRLERGGLLPLSGGLEALLSHASNLRRMERVVATDLKALRALEGRGRDLRSETSQLTGEIAQAEASLSRTRRANALQQAETARESQFEQAFEHSQGPVGHVVRTPTGTLSLLDEEPLPSSFRDQRGNLALPVSGPSEIREATRADSDGPGLEFAARPGSTVRASEAGRVAFCDDYQSYGRIVILDHGDRYYTVYAGLGRMDVRAGDDVSRSARLGAVADDGVLYFEVRRGTRTQPPRPWLGL